MVRLVVGGLFNAIASAGSGFLFSKLNHTIYEAKLKRHNMVIEKMQKANEQWYENG